jgi:hypothetical protein
MENLRCQFLSQLFDIPLSIFTGMHQRESESA